MDRGVRAAGDRCVGVTTMRWFRSRVRWGAGLALFALALQLILSFGHVHLEGISLAHASTVVGEQAPADSTDPASLPAHPDEGVADDYCPICALIHLAGTLISADAPLLALSTISGRRQLAPKSAAALTASPRGSYSARAPPLA